MPRRSAGDPPPAPVVSKNSNTDSKKAGRAVRVTRQASGQRGIGRCTPLAECPLRTCASPGFRLERLRATAATVRTATPPATPGAALRAPWGSFCHSDEDSSSDLLPSGCSAAAARTPFAADIVACAACAALACAVSRASDQRGLLLPDSSPAVALGRRPRPRPPGPNGTGMPGVAPQRGGSMVVKSSEAVWRRSWNWRRRPLLKPPVNPPPTGQASDAVVRCPPCMCG